MVGQRSESEAKQKTGKIEKEVAAFLGFFLVMRVNIFFFGWWWKLIRKSF